ncbi:hypothetical protein BDN70DRAFT_297701 [Pholiota conissans]|uniref:Uncharacterized protein n=1 Tax=Pholiota conissans TaxID=109636 RepID=A0A9P5YSJ3_9AGAR|nr:hypothetical protein BDN70DRAFT_297701 [Pholiota conissans]
MYVWLFDTRLSSLRSFTRMGAWVLILTKVTHHLSSSLRRGRLPMCHRSKRARSVIIQSGRGFAHLMNHGCLNLHLQVTTSTRTTHSIYLNPFKQIWHCPNVDFSPLRLFDDDVPPAMPTQSVHLRPTVSMLQIPALGAVCHSTYILSIFFPIEGLRFTAVHARGDAVITALHSCGARRTLIH